MKRALRMVLMGDGRTEEREDAISGILYVAVVAPRGVDHYFQRRVDDRARLLGIEVLLELGRALDIGKQSRDGLALALGIFGGGYTSY